MQLNSLVVHNLVSKILSTHLCDFERNKYATMGLNLKTACRINDRNCWIIENEVSRLTISFCKSQVTIFPIRIHF